MKNYLLSLSILTTVFALSYNTGYAVMIGNEATGALSTVGNVTTIVTPASLTGVTTIAGSITGATSVTVNTGSDITFNPAGNLRVTIPASTVITPATGTGFDTTAITTTAPVVSSGLGASEVSRGALEFGISNVGLIFSKPIRIDIPVTGVSASTINVKVKHGGTSTYVTTGLTNDENATCTAGIPSVPSNVAVVAGGIATIYSCQASTFVAVATVSSGGGSSGGSSGGGPGTFTPVPATLLPINSTEIDTTQGPDTLQERLRTLATTFPRATLELRNLGFRDIGDNWARMYIEKLAVRKVIRNAENFNPDAALTRAEYMKIIVNAFGWKLPTTMANLGYNDVPRTHSLAAYIALARSEGLISATLPSFRPDAPITRAEAMKILILALEAEVSDVPVSFSDVDKQSDLAKYIEKAKMYGIITGQKIGTRTYFRPNDSITRAEIAKIIALALEF